MSSSFLQAPKMAFMVDSCEAMVFPIDSNKSVPAPFLSKTYQLVDDSFTDHIVSWGQDNNTFVVWRPPEFARDILPLYFKHNNLSSFVRQLNTYGFRKVVPDRWEFANGYFRKGEKHMLCEIHRRKTSPASSTVGHGFPLDVRLFNAAPFSKHLSLSSSHSESESDSLPAGLPFTERASNAINAFSEDNERLRRSNAMLMSELAYMKNLYTEVVFFLQNHVRHLPCHLGPAVVSGHSNAMNGAASNWNSSSSSAMENCARDCSPKSHSGISFEEELPTASATKLFGVPLQGRIGNPGPNCNFFCQTDDLKLNL